MTEKPATPNLDAVVYQATRNSEHPRGGQGPAGHAVVTEQRDMLLDAVKAAQASVAEHRANLPRQYSGTWDVCQCDGCRMIRAMDKAVA